MAYKDLEKKRATTRERVRRHRAKQNVTSLVTPCPDCGGKGFIEREHGLIMVKCRCKY